MNEHSSEATEIYDQKHAVQPANPTTSVGSKAEWPTIEGFEIFEELGSGGMGTVYKAKNTKWGDW